MEYGVSQLEIPTVPVEIDTNSPLARGLVRLYLFYPPYPKDILYGGIPVGVPTNGAPPFTISEIGPTAYWSSTSNQYGWIVGDGPLIGPLSTWTMTSYASVNGADGSDGSAIYCERALSGNDICKLIRSDTNTSSGDYVGLVYRNDGGSITQLNGATYSIVDGLFHEMSATYDGSTMAVWADGKLDNSTTFTSGTAFTNSGLLQTIGYDAQDISKTGWAGNIGRIALYNRALSAQELTWLAKEPFSMLRVAKSFRTKSYSTNFNSIQSVQVEQTWTGKSFLLNIAKIVNEKTASLTGASPSVNLTVVSPSKSATFSGKSFVYSDNYNNVIVSGAQKTLLFSENNYTVNRNYTIPSKISNLSGASFKTAINVGVAGKNISSSSTIKTNYSVSSNQKNLAWSSNQYITNKTWSTSNTLNWSKGSFYVNRSYQFPLRDMIVTGYGITIVHSVSNHVWLWNKNNFAINTSNKTQSKSVTSLNAPDVFRVDDKFVSKVVSYSISPFVNISFIPDRVDVTSSSSPIAKFNISFDKSWLWNGYSFTITRNISLDTKVLYWGASRFDYSNYIPSTTSKVFGSFSVPTVTVNTSNTSGPITSTAVVLPLPAATATGLTSSTRSIVGHPIMVYKVPQIVRVTYPASTAFGGLFLDNYPFNRTDFRMVRGVQNEINFYVRDVDRKPVALGISETLTINIVDVPTNTLLMSRNLTVIDNTQGIYLLTVLPNEMTDWPTTALQWSLSYTRADGSTVLMWTDRNYSPYSTVHIMKEPVPGPAPSVTILWSNFSLLPDSNYYSPTLVGSGAKGVVSGSTQTFVMTLSNFTGSVRIDGSMAASPVNNNVSTDWTQIDLQSYTANTGVVLLNEQASSYLWMRMVVIFGVGGSGLISQVQYKG